MFFFCYALIVQYLCATTCTRLSLFYIQKKRQFRNLVIVAYYFMDLFFSVTCANVGHTKMLFTFWQTFLLFVDILILALESRSEYARSIKFNLSSSFLEHYNYHYYYNNSMDLNLFNIYDIHSFLIFYSSTLNTYSCLVQYLHIMCARGGGGDMAGRN